MSDDVYQSDLNDANAHHNPGLIIDIDEKFEDSDNETGSEVSESEIASYVHKAKVPRSRKNPILNIQHQLGDFFLICFINSNEE